MPDASDRVDLVLGTSLGGVGRHVRALAEAIVENGRPAGVHGPAATETTFRFTAAGAEFVAVDIPGGLAPVRAVHAASALREQLRDARLVHAHGLRAGVLTARARGGLKANAQWPLVVTWHNVPQPARRLPGLQHRLESQLAKAAQVSLAVSPDLVERVRSLGGRDVRLAPVGAEPLPAATADRATVRRELAAGDRPIALCVGRLHKQKGLDVLIRAVGSLPEDRRPLLVVAGDGPEREVLARGATGAGVDVRWLGYVAERGRLADLMQAADLVVVPSRWEGSPLAVHEALLAGRPVIATAVGGLTSLLEHSDVALVPADDVPTLARAIDDVLSDPTRAADLAKASRSAAVRWPDARAGARQVLDVYDEFHRA